MKFIRNAFLAYAACSISVLVSAQPEAVRDTSHRKLFIDVHRLEPGKVTYEAVADAHKKDLAAEGEYNVQFLKYWVDESKGLVYCLSSAPDTTSIVNTHRKAHGLLPTNIYPVSDGIESALVGDKNLYLDIHYLGAGNVTAAAVADAHKKDLAAEGKHGVHFINYWVNEKDGVVMCLSEAKTPEDVIETHREAHGLLPKEVLKVKEGK